MSCGRSIVAQTGEGEMHVAFANGKRIFRRDFGGMIGSVAWLDGCYYEEAPRGG